MTISRSDKIRAAMLERPDLFEAIRLTGKQREAVHAVRDHGVGHSTFVAGRLGVSHQQACALLKAGMDKGYLSRRNVGDPTGGTQWAYSYRLHR